MAHSHRRLRCLKSLSVPAQLHRLMDIFRRLASHLGIRITRHLSLVPSAFDPDRRGPDLIRGSAIRRHEIDAESVAPGCDHEADWDDHGGCLCLLRRPAEMTC